MPVEIGFKIEFRGGDIAISSPKAKAGFQKRETFYFEVFFFLALD